MSGCGSAPDPTRQAQAITKATFETPATVTAVPSGYSNTGVSETVLEIEAGQGIKFVNSDSVNRSFQGRLGDRMAFDSGVQLPGDNFMFRAALAGTIAITDRFNPQAKLTLVVKPAALSQK